MEHLELLAIGIAIGIAASAPVGAVNVMTIQRVLRHGILAGLAAGLGAVMADVLFATAAALGLSAVDDFIDRHVTWFQFAGAWLVIAFGVLSLRSHPTMRQTEASPKRVSSAATAFAMTITNPGTMFGFLALFGALGDLAPEAGEWLRVTHLLLGVAIGGVAWWTGLAVAVSRLRERLTDHTLELINRLAGSLLIGFGAVILGRLALMQFGLL